MVKISYVSLTCRDSILYDGRPDLHLFYPSFVSLQKQTETDFEWVIVDALYHMRPNYFKDSPFPIKHVPAEPNFWHDHGLPGLSRQYNKGIIYADGELVFFGVDGWIFPENFLKQLWLNYLSGNYPMAWYMIDSTFNPRPPSPTETKSPFPYNYYGYTGKRVIIDHRYTHMTEYLGRNIYPHSIWTWFFSGCASVPLDVLLELNGFDHNMDGDKLLMDVDLGSRLQMAKRAHFILDSELYLIRCSFINALPFLPNIAKLISIKCNHGLIGLNRQRGWIRANEHLVTEKDVDWIKTEGCANRCELRDFCMKTHPWQYPFRHQKHPDHEYWFKLWLNNQKLINLEEERELRIENNEKYSKGTYIE